MSLKQKLLLIGVVIVAIVIISIYNTKDTIELLDPSTTAHVDDQNLHDQNLSINDTSLNAEPSKSVKAEKPANAKTVSFFLASQRCKTEVKALFKEYKVNGEFFRALDNLAKQKLLTAEGEKNDFYYAGMARLYYLPQPSYVANANNLMSPDFKKSQFHLERTLRNKAIYPESDDFILAIDERNYVLAEDLLAGIVRGASDGILSDSASTWPLLKRALFTSRGIQPRTESDKTMKAIIDIFNSADYPLHFAELVDLESTFPRDQNDALEYLLDSFTIDLSTVFDTNQEKSTNLVLSALHRFDFDKAAFWINKGVDPFSNFKVVNKLKRGHGMLMLDESKVSDETIQVLLNSGLFTTGPNQYIEENISKRFPSVDARNYYEQHQRVSILSKAEDQRLQGVLADLAHELVAIHTAGKLELSEGCEDEYLSRLKSMHKYIQERRQDTSQKEKFEQLFAQASKIYNEYKDKLIDADLALEQLSLIDEYKSKQRVDLIIGMERTSELPSLFQQGNKAKKPEVMPDMSLFEEIEEASLNNDYERVLELSSSLDPYYQLQVKIGLLSLAIKNKAPTAVFKLLLKNIDMPAQLVISTVLNSNDMQLLENILEAGFDINAVDQLNRRLLTMAVKKKHEQALRTLIRLGVDVEQPEIGLDALDIALADIIQGYPDYFFVQHLLKANKRIEDSHRQLLQDLLIMYPEPTQRVIDKYGIVM
jgi:hypothetical protein